MVGAVRRATIKVSGVMALSVQLTMTHNTTSPLTALPTEPSGCHTPILKPKMRSRKGSVESFVLQVGELLPRDDIFNE